MQIFHHGYLGYDEWAKDSLWTRLANYTQFSGAFVPSDGTTQPGEAAVGVAIPLIDQTNWQMNKDVVKQYMAGFQPFFAGVITDQFPQDAVGYPTGDVKSEADLDSRLASFKVRIAGDQQKIKQFVATLNVATGAAGQTNSSKSFQTDLNAYDTALTKYQADLSALKYSDLPTNSATGSRTIPEPIGLPSTSPLHAVAEDWVAEGKSYLPLRGDASDAFFSGSANKDPSKTYEQSLSDYMSSFANQANNSFWNQWKWDVAFGSGWGTLNNEYSELFTTGSQLWTTLSLPLVSAPLNPNATTVRPSAGLTLFGSLLWDDRKFKSGSYTDAGDGFQAGARLKVQTATLNFFIEGLDKTTTLAGKTSSATQWDVGIEKELAKNHWIQASFGNDINNPGGTLFGITYSYNFSTSPSLTTSAPTKPTAPGK